MDRRTTGGSCGTELLQRSKNAPRSRPSPLRSLVVNLDSRPDRWEAMQKRLRPLQTSGLLTVERLPAIDGNNASVPNEVIASKKLETIATVEELLEDYSKYAGGDMLPEMRLGLNVWSVALKQGALDWSAGEIGCAMSHVRAWKEVVAGSEPVLILEDDAKFDDDLVEASLQALALAGDDLDVLLLEYLSFECWILRSDAACPTRDALLPLTLVNASRSYSFGETVETLGSGRTLFKAVFVLNSAAYLLTPAGAGKLLSALPLRYEIDLTMGYMMHKKALQAFLIYPPLA